LPTFAHMKKSLFRIKTAIWNYGYGQAIEKIAFTTIGLLLALWINNWNDQRKARKDERELLAEIRSGLLQDKKDIQETATGYALRATATELVIKHIELNLPETDSLRDAFQYLHGFSFLLANTGAYETLKSRGSETIKSDSLRVLIATLYDVDYERVKEYEEFSNHIYKQVGLPLYYQTLSRRQYDLKALNWPQLRRNNTFREVVLFTSYNCSQLNAEYLKLGQSVDRIIAMIDQELTQ
jgi:Family of unknown function (DUF6090)